MKKTSKQHKRPFPARAGLILLIVVIFLNSCRTDNHVKILYSGESTQQQSQEASWHEVQKGLMYANVLVDTDDGTRKEFFLVKVDPKLFEFRIYNNSDQSKAKSLQEIQQEQGSVLTFNGAFFDTKFKAMGLLQDATSASHQQISSKLMNGIFYIGENFTNGIHPLNNPPKDNKAFMLQNGPVLIDETGSIPLTKDTAKLAARTALGVDRDGTVILIVLHQSLLNTDNTLSLYQLAHLLKESPTFRPLGLHSVLNLDGGPSTGVIIGSEYLPEINSVQNAIITIPRK